jgi:hypothetical protein
MGDRLKRAFLATIKTRCKTNEKGCWLWTGPVDNDGYGISTRMRIGGKEVKSHPSNRFLLGLWLAATAIGSHQVRYSAMRQSRAFRAIHRHKEHTARVGSNCHQCAERAMPQGPPLQSEVSPRWMGAYLPDISSGTGAHQARQEVISKRLFHASRGDGIGCPNGPPVFFTLVADPLQAASL